MRNTQSPATYRDWFLGTDADPQHCRMAGNNHESTWPQTLAWLQEQLRPGESVWVRSERQTSKAVTELSRQGLYDRKQRGWKKVASG